MTGLESYGGGDDELGKTAGPPEPADGSQPTRIGPAPPTPPTSPPPLPIARPLPQATPLSAKPAARPGPNLQTAPDIQPTSRGPQNGGRRAANEVGPLTIDAPEPDPLEQEDLKTAAIKSAPAWLVSFVFHTLIIIILGLIYVGREIPQTIALNATYAETLGTQLEDDQLQGTTLRAQDVKDPALALDKLPADDPLARPPDHRAAHRRVPASDRLTAPSIGLALTGREAGMKRALLAKYGGTATTEAAVGRALEWLKRNQRRDGTWSLTGPYHQRRLRDENKTSATAMALLAFQGDWAHARIGQLPDSKSTAAGCALLKMQDQDGNFYQGGNDEQRLYSQAQATIAICEIYGMTQASDVSPAGAAGRRLRREDPSPGRWLAISAGQSTPTRR